MHDLNTLRFMNESNHAEYERKKASTVIEVISEKLSNPRPPALAVLIARYSNADDFNMFVRLIRKYLPEREVDILSGTSPAAQMSSFATYFEDRYLPLHNAIKDGIMEDDYNELLRDIPVYTMGFGWEDYEELNNARLGCQLMSYIFSPPAENDKEQQNVRISLADGFPPEYQVNVRRLPVEGLSVHDAQSIFRGKKWFPLKSWAEYINQDTNNWFLDTDEEMRSQCMIMDWFEEGIIDAMTADWKVAESRCDKMMDFATWLEDKKEGPQRFKQVVDFILAHTKKKDIEVDEDGRVSP